MSQGRTVLLAAGGTGGHMFPAAALAAAMAARGWRAALVTDGRGLALAKDFPADPILEIAAATLSPRAPLKAIVGAGQIVRGVMRARNFIDRLRPAVVVGFGGYPAFPTLFAAQGRAPIVLHEQNAVLGRVNRAFASRAAAIASGFARLDRLDPKLAGRWTITGNPVRAPIRALAGGSYVAPSGAVPIELLVVGGSLGARLLGEVAPAAIARLPEALRGRIHVVQQVRPESLEAARSVYASAGVIAECAPFFPDIAERLARAHVVIGRAGASTVTELAVAGRPSILVPLGIAMDDHQSENARALVDLGAADALTEAEFTPEALAGLLDARLSQPADLAARAAAARGAARPDAAEALADLVEATAGTDRR